uniref:Uncharacterized protein n=1 Tax=Ditylenchus dipsaci TaxID=166011 RepID=A0A915DTC3_9BILA
MQCVQPTKDAQTKLPKSAGFEGPSPLPCRICKKVAELESKNQEKVIAQRETMEAHFGKSQVTSAIGEDKTIKEILEKCRHLVGHFNHSNQAKDRLREEQEREEAPFID